jgi:hypothetical protein
VYIVERSDFGVSEAKAAQEVLEYIQTQQEVNVNGKRELRIVKPSVGLRWGVLVGCVIVAGIPTFVLSRLWSLCWGSVVLTLILIVFALVFYGVAFLLLSVAWSKSSITVDPERKTITTGTRLLFEFATRYRTYHARDVADLVIKPGEKSGYVVNILLKNGQQDFLDAFPSKAEALGFTERAASILWPEEVGRPAANDAVEPGEADSRNINDLVIEESGFIAGLVGSVFIAVISLLFLLVGYFHGVLEFTIIPAGVFGFLILVIFPKIFQKRVVLFDAGKRNVTIHERSMLHMSGRMESCHWDEIKDVLVREEKKGKYIVYGLYLVLPKLEPKTLVKYYGKEQEAEEMRTRIAALLRRESGSPDGA